jgi:TPR repeat protein
MKKILILLLTLTSLFASMDAFTAYKNKDYKTAFVELKKLDNNPQALYLLGNMYYSGTSTSKDSSKAISLWEKSAKMGFIRAQYKLGNVYYQGKGTLKDATKAFYWYEKAAKQGVVKAQFLVGGMCETGEGVQKNSEKALSWYQKAADNGSASAQFF